MATGNIDLRTMGFEQYGIWQNNFRNAIEHNSLDSFFKMNCKDSLKYLPRQALRRLEDGQERTFFCENTCLNVYNENGNIGYILSDEQSGTIIAEGRGVRRGVNKFIGSAVGLRCFLYIPCLLMATD